MTVKELFDKSNIRIEDIKEHYPGEFFNSQVAGISYNSKEIKKGYLFFAIKGNRIDGHEFIQEAFKNKAIGAVVEKDVDYVNTIKVRSTLQALRETSLVFYDYPFKKLFLGSVTGTNGKSTITWILSHAVNKLLGKSFALGTLGWMHAGKIIRKTSNTTPESKDICELLDQAIQLDMKYGFLEVSSHALKLGRLHGIQFDAALFTNLARDHMDFHPSVEDYFETKKSLFTSTYLKENAFVVINIDDLYGINLYNGIKDFRKASFSLENEKASFFGKFEPVDRGVCLLVEGQKVFAPIYGRFNASNLLGAYTFLRMMGIEKDKLGDAFVDLVAPYGRLECVQTKPFKIWIDYAHTPDGLEKVLKSLRDMVEKKIILVFGAGGNRDKGKRPIMGRIAAQFSDYTIITSDNPRYEDPMSIIDEIKSGFLSVKNSNFEILSDRREAIKRAIEIARDNDAIIIAGKGHEDYQEINGVKYPFSDKEVVKELIHR
ncbi:UDP-N-acetylmuramoyl-L-alanyl-D-glutamate--2,6-diaminopimelate ligase [Thermodesulfobium narugense DSM 14796]|uniref:UDP-N-acetylmuramoyl-L-alanyl-D-glutamate--2,6-diaminopimelate ligase n=1 Tax=Thermodesulfobium narugense DSM 14796 TaxID=747365 RepID=M1E732_9BACT|nr:UDP-N-acetylmuramoyl-L-alanyl-D-glutamate--2,6-diaminopimelate ligase [Thermodesulfobium narugense]AEE14295.1 UDP-N-acetylmuramoyl-L-alanyl-D-glutamate--2,6-diaminopimelate ligase [Thermodesulfobium narugense DSM 14796]